MNIKVSLLASVVLILYLQSCNETSIDNDISSSQQIYFPAKLGYKWSYDHYITFTNKEGIVDSVKGETYSISIEKNDTCTIGVPFFRVFWRYKFEVVGEGWYVTKDSAGVFDRDCYSPYKFIEFPLIVGRSWDARNQTTMAVKNVSASVQTKAGQFRNCVEIEQKNNDPIFASSVSYYAPLIGLVLQRSSSWNTQSGYAFDTIELTGKNF